MDIHRPYQDAPARQPVDLRGRLGGGAQQHRDRTGPCAARTRGLRLQHQSAGPGVQLKGPLHPGEAVAGRLRLHHGRRSGQPPAGVIAGPPAAQTGGAESRDARQSGEVSDVRRQRNSARPGPATLGIDVAAGRHLYVRRAPVERALVEAARRLCRGQREGRLIAEALAPGRQPARRREIEATGGPRTGRRPVPARLGRRSLADGGGECKPARPGRTVDPRVEEEGLCGIEAERAGQGAPVASLAWASRETAALVMSNPTRRKSPGWARLTAASLPLAALSRRMSAWPSSR